MHHDRSHLSHFLCRLIILEISVKSVDVVHAARLLDALSPPFSSNCCVSQNSSALSHPSCLLDALQHKRHFAGLCYQDFPIIIYWIDMGKKWRIPPNGIELFVRRNILCNCIPIISTCFPNHCCLHPHISHDMIILRRRVWCP